MKPGHRHPTPGGCLAKLAERDTTDALYIILAGRVKVFVADRDGHELVLGEMGAGEYFGEMVLDGGPRSASIMTLEKTRFAVVSRETFVEYLNANPAFAMRLIKQLIRRVRTLTGSVKSLALLDVYGRVARLLIDLAERDGEDWAVPGRLTHQEIASRIGSSREMVTRIPDAQSACRRRHRAGAAARTPWPGLRRCSWPRSTSANSATSPAV